MERLGATQGTTLFRATRPDTHRGPAEVALRVADRQEDPTATEAIRAEYEVLRMLEDAHLPKVVAHYPGQAALAVTWCGGFSLADALAVQRSGWGRLDPQTALDVTIEAARALQAAHALVREGRPLVHGHLGPQRVRLDDEGNVYLVGLGVSPRGWHPAYLSPEQAARGPIDPRTDQWALGAMLVEMLLRRRLYDGVQNPAGAALEGRVEPWVADIEHLSPGVGRVLRKLLAASPDDRFPSDGEVLHALLSAARELGGVANRGAMVASVQRHHDLLASSREPSPTPSPSPAMTVSAIPVHDELTDPDEEDEDESLQPVAVPRVAIGIGGGDEADPFPDDPTSPDGEMRLAEVFSESPTTPGVDLSPDPPTDPGAPGSLGVLVSGEDLAKPAGSAPAPRTARLQPAEIAGLAFGALLLLVGLAWLATRS